MSYCFQQGTVKDFNSPKTVIQLMESLFRLIAVITLLPFFKLTTGMVVGFFESDFLSLYAATSTLPVPGIGHGVFAKYDIPKGSYLCEYTGYVYPQEDYVPGVVALSIQRPDGHPYHLLSTSICSYINDAINPLAYDGSNSPPLFEGKEHNAALLYTSSGKIYAVATQDIQAYSEVFLDYGRFPYC